MGEISVGNPVQNYMQKNYENLCILQRISLDLHSGR